MRKQYLNDVAEDIYCLKNRRDHYRMIFLMKKHQLQTRDRKAITYLFERTDRIRNQLILWLKRMVGAHPSTIAYDKNTVERKRYEMRQHLNRMNQKLCA